jgi:hypothetical protein
MPYPAIDLSKVKTYSLADRASLVNIDQFITPSSPVPSFDNPDLIEIADRILTARRSGAALIWMIGAHVVKRGLAPLLIDLMQSGLITHLACNGATTIHDFEIAMLGSTSEDVASALEDGSFGMAEETGAYMNHAIQQGYHDGIGLGEALGIWIDTHPTFTYQQYSLAYQSYRCGVPLSVHVAIGTDIIHQHPNCDFAAVGWTSGLDFKIFCASVSQLEGGVFCNFGSAVIGPEVFLKALSVVRNLGYRVREFTTANFDLLPLEYAHQPVGDDQPEYYYRPRKNVIIRPVSLGGHGYHIVGDHRVTIPNLALLLRQGLTGEESMQTIGADH